MFGPIVNGSSQDRDLKTVINQARNQTYAANLLEKVNNKLEFNDRDEIELTRILVDDLVSLTTM